ncbi:predicted protein [Nematostella vectensis]|uniref:Uncharacterized protein n=1 Tax=Nematostella vectensis TaxID=45351 RepID=A7SZX8_NEMVE|nr:predicted protein [Nematostella vectensis]|eukprot:XP_001622838.1 predicted protein [Nematostella vectensis]
MSVTLLIEFLYAGDLSTVYELSAVLMHHGSSAYSGHYVAHIRDNKELVAKDNSVFEAWTREMDAIKESMITEGKMNQAEIRSIYEMLPAATTDYAEWVSTDWLRKWLSDKYKATPPIDNSSLLCCHGRLSPEKYQYSKRISCKAADVLYTKYGGVPRLQRDSMCRECVQRKCRSIQFRLRLNEDDKAIKALNKPSHKISTTSSFNRLQELSFLIFIEIQDCSLQCIIDHKVYGK